MSKFGFCKYGKRCDKIDLTDTCEMFDNCKEKYFDKRHLRECLIWDSTEAANFTPPVATDILQEKKEISKMMLIIWKLIMI